MTPLRLAFMGSPDFALPALRALGVAGHQIAAVYCQPPRPAGRGHKERRCPVQAYAEAQGWPLRTPATLKDGAEQTAFAALGLDAAVVVAYGLILPKAVLEAPRLGCINLHASLLPRWRGAAPIQRAILADDRETGVTIMRVEAELDAGPILVQQSVPVTEATTAADLHDRLAALGARMIVDALEGLAAGTIEPRPQPEQGATYAAKLARGEGRLDWRKPASELERRVRALTPRPGAFFEIDGERIKVLAAEVVAGVSGAAPGAVLDAHLTVACGTGALRPTRVQRGGKAAMDAEALLRGFPIAAGSRLPPPGAEP